MKQTLSHDALRVIQLGLTA